MSIELEITDAYRCSECEEVSAETSGEPLYECGECGSKEKGDEGRRCGDCNKFRSKLADDSCAECDEGEVEETEVIECPQCGELHEVDEFAEHDCSPGGCPDFKTLLRQEWAEGAVEATRKALRDKGLGDELLLTNAPLSLALLVECPCGEKVSLDEYAEHAAECDDATGEEDVGGERIEAAIAAARQRRADADRAAAEKAAAAKKSAAAEKRAARKNPAVEQAIADGKVKPVTPEPAQ